MLLIVNIVKFEVMMTLTLNVFWDVTPSRYVDGYKGFEKNPSTLIFGVEMCVVLIQVLKISLLKNSIKCSRADSDVKLR